MIVAAWLLGKWSSYYDWLYHIIKWLICHLLNSLVRQLVEVLSTVIVEWTGAGLVRYFFLVLSIVVATVGMLERFV